MAEEKKKFKFPRFLQPKFLIIIGLLILGLLVWRFKGYFIVATVNGQPISRWELTDQLIRRFGQQTLDNIINERLILAAARQKGVFVTSPEIDARVKQIEENLKGQTTLSEALAVQGLSENMFRRQIEIQVSIEKLFDKDASVSATEIDQYIKDNAAIYKSSTEPAKIREEVTQNLKQQKVGQLFDEWFTQTRKSANVKKFL